MIRFGMEGRSGRISLLGVALVASTGAWTATGAAATRDTSGAQAIVRLTEVGIVGVPAGDSASAVRIIVYATGPARIGISGEEPAPLTDTLRLSTLPAITADVSDSDVHIRLLSAGRLRVGGPVTGGRAIRLTATGRHIVLLKGGVGADTITDE